MLFCAGYCLSGVGGLTLLQKPVGSRGCVGCRVGRSAKGHSGEVARWDFCSAI